MTTSSCCSGRYLHSEQGTRHRAAAVHRPRADGRVHTIRLNADQPQTPELWLRSFNGDKWLFFNPGTGEQGLPGDRLVWWTGDEPLISTEGGRNPQVTFTLNNSEMNAIRLAKLTDENTEAGFWSIRCTACPCRLSRPTRS